MRRLLLLIVASSLAGGCGLLPTPTATNTPRPTRTPILIGTVIVTAEPPATLPPTWTPSPSLTPPPTATRLPTSTPLPTRTPIPPNTPAGGRIGVVTTAGLLTVAVDLAELNAALRAERDTFYFSADFNGAPSATFDGRLVILAANLNDFTIRGLPATFRLQLRAIGGELAVEVAGFESASQTSISPAQVSLTRELLRRAVRERALPDAIRKVAPFMVEYSALDVQMQPDRILFTVRIRQATPTPTDLPTETPSAP